MGIGRPLAEANPAAHAAYLAGFLRNLAACLRKAGCEDEAEAAEQEAATLQEQTPDAEAA